MACGRARQQEPAQVDAPDDEQERGARDEHHDRPLVSRAQIGESARDRRDRDARAPQILLLRRRQRAWHRRLLHLGPQRAHVGARLFDRDTRTQARDEIPRAVRARQVAAPLPEHRERDRDIGRAVDLEPVELRRRHADDRERRRRVHRHPLSDRAGIPAEVPLPESIADHRDGRRVAARRRVGRRQQPAEKRVDAEHLVQLRRGRLHDRVGGRAAGQPHDRRDAARVRRQQIEHVLARAKRVQRVEVDHPDHAALRIGERHVDKTIRFRNGQLAQDEAVQHAEQRRVRADGEHQREDDDERESRRADERSQAVANVEDQRVDHRSEGARRLPPSRTLRRTS